MQKPDLPLVRKAIFLIGRRFRRHWAMVVALTVMMAFLEAVAAVVVFALIQLLDDPQGRFSLPMVGQLQLAEGAARLWFLAGAGSFFLVRSLVVLWHRYLQHRTEQMVGADLAERLTRGYLAMPYHMHLQRNSSELIRNSLWSVNEVVINLLTPVSTIFSEGLVALALFVTLFVTSPVGVGVAVGAVAPLVWLVLRAVQPRIQQLGRQAEDAIGAAHRHLSQALHGIREVKVSGREPFFLAGFSRHRELLARSRYKAAVLQEVPKVSLETVVLVSVVAVLSIVTLRGAEASDLLAVFGIFGYATLRLLPGLNKVVAATNRLRFGRAAVDNVYRDLIELPRGDDWEDPEETRPLVLQRSLVLDRVGFRYPSAAVPAVDGVSLEVRRGESIGIVGSTGSGKTTLLSLIVGLLAPDQGRIEVDGVDIHTNLRGWQSQIGLVPQGVFLLDDTLRRNIALGIPDEEIDEETLREAVELAQLTEVVASLPDGLDTLVGERGVRLSGGQKQRVAIARALYRRPRLLVFDEGTSALDNLTEAALLEALARLRGEFTMITVAHRLTTVKDCDRVVLMVDGKVADVGSFTELTERNYTFAQMAKR